MSTDTFDTDLCPVSYPDAISVFNRFKAFLPFSMLIIR